MPEGVHQVIGKRLSRLSRQANQLGEPLMFKVLSAMLAVDPPTQLDLLDEVVRGGLVREEGERYNFSHALVRETLYRGLTLARRKRLHFDAAVAIELEPAPTLERHLGDLAVHYDRAGEFANPEKTIDYAERAGDAANAGLLMKRRQRTGLPRSNTWTSTRAISGARPLVGTTR